MYAGYYMQQEDICLHAIATAMMMLRRRPNKCVMGAAPRVQNDNVAAQWKQDYLSSEMRDTQSELGHLFR